MTNNDMALALLAAFERGQERRPKFLNSVILKVRQTERSKYKPHQGKKERERRLIKQSRETTAPPLGANTGA